MNIQNISPEEARRKIQEGAVLIDVRNRDEYAREHITEARPLPLSEIDRLDALLSGGAANGENGGTVLVFHCQSGMRTQNGAAALAQAAGAREAYIMTGGLAAWKKAGLPVVVDRSQPMELMRQVQIAAGCLILLGFAGGVWISPYFYGLCAFVGAGLTVAGVTGFCGMARLLRLMPWNRNMQ